MKTESTRRSLAAWAAAIGAAALLCSAGYGLVLLIMAGGRSLCLFRTITGHECPGCGMTRAFVALLHGDVAGAFRHNRMSLIVLPLLAYVTVRWLRLIVQRVMRPRR